MSTHNRGLSIGTNNGFGRVTVPSPLSPRPRSCSPQAFIVFSRRKRVSNLPAESSQSPLPILQSANEDSTADDEVDSTSECADSEYSIPPAKIPVFSGTVDEDAEETETKENSFAIPEISSIKSLTATVENKCRDMHSQAQKLQKKVLCLEKEIRVLKHCKRTLESNLQEEKENSTVAQEKQQNAERCLQAEQEYSKELERKLQNAEKQLEKERVVSNQRKQKLQHVLQNFQSELDEAYRQENVPESIEWFSGHDTSALPKISLIILITFLTELTSIWEQLGVALGVEHQVDIERTTSTTANLKCMNVLRFWMSHTHASWPAFLDALTKLKKRQLAIQIEQHLLNEK